MRRKMLKQVAVIIGIILVSLMITYAGLAIYYRNAFEYGTWINGVYCTGRSVEEVNEELASAFSYAGITVKDKDGNAYTIDAGDISYDYDFGKALEIFLQQQNSWVWVESLFHSKEIQLNPVVSYDGARLEEVLDEIPFLAEGIPEQERRVAIIKTNQGYELLNERTGVLDVQEAREATRLAVEESQSELSLEEAGCYHDLELSEEMQRTLELWNKIEDWQDCGIVYRFGGDTVPVDASVVCDWIEKDEQGEFVLDEQDNLQLQEEAVDNFVDSLADEYDTVGAERQFRATSGRMVTVKGGIYGNKIDRKAEKKYLKEAFEQKKKEIHEPSYEQTGWKLGKDDIGTTYIEVDMGEQMMYYYKDGRLELETPVVTGNTSLRRGTPEGVNYVYLKQTNRILRGPGYASHVDFWMPVKGGIGIHDASWRSRYGGTIYKTNGSHGCINTPRDIMEKLYETAEVGTPVVMFY